MYRFVVHRPVATAMAYAAVVLLGVISLFTLEVDLLPKLDLPMLTIWTVYPDGAAEEVERLVTVPIEEIVNTVPGVKRVRSFSRPGVSVIMVEFVWGTPMDFAGLDIRGKLDALRGEIPQRSGRPTIVRLDPSDQPIIGLAITGANKTNLQPLVENVVKRRLEQAENVAIALVVGGAEPEIQIEVDPRRLKAFDIPIGRLNNALHYANADHPGATIRVGRYRYALRTLGSFESASQIEDVVIEHKTGGKPIRLSDLAAVRETNKELPTITHYGGQQALGVLIRKRAGSNTVTASNEVRFIIRQLMHEHPELKIVVAFDQAEFVSETIQSALWMVFQGGILAFAVLFLFLRGARDPVCVAVSIPISVAASFVMFDLAEVDLNIVSIGGLALGIGMLVDNSIVVMENIHRHREIGGTTIEAAIDGAREVGSPLAASTLTTLSVFLPIAYVAGVAGQLFRDQSLAVSFSLLSSLAVSLTLLPMIAARRRRSTSMTGKTEATLGDMSHGKRGRHILDSFRISIDATRFLYEKALIWSLTHRTIVLGSAGFLVLGSGWIGWDIRRELMPAVDQRALIVQLWGQDGSSLSEAVEATKRIEETLGKMPSVVATFSTIGLDQEPWQIGRRQTGLNVARIHVHLGHNKEKRAIVARLEEELANLQRFSGTVFREENVLSRILATNNDEISVRVIGNDLQALTGIANRLKTQLLGVQGLSKLRVASESTQSEINIKISPNELARYGLSVQDVVDQVTTYASGRIATKLRTFDREIDVVVRPEGDRVVRLESLLSMPIAATDVWVPIRKLVKVQNLNVVSEIEREGGTRFVQVTARASGRPTRDIVKEINRQISSLAIPPGYRLEIGGISEEIHSSFQSLLLMLLLSVFLVYMILAAQFESFVQPFVIILSVPMAIIGAIVAIFLTGHSVNLISLIGIVVLVGLAVNDAIVKIDFINQRRRQGLPIVKAVLDAGHCRMRPILITSITTMLGLLPMALGIGVGAELRAPLAVALIGGLVSSTLLTLIVIPVVYCCLDREVVKSTI